MNKFKQYKAIVVLIEYATIKRHKSRHCFICVSVLIAGAIILGQIVYEFILFCVERKFCLTLAGILAVGP